MKLFLFSCGKKFICFLFEQCLGNRSHFSYDLNVHFLKVGGQKNVMSASLDTEMVAAADRQTIIMPKCFGKCLFRVKKRRRSEAYFLPATRLSPISRLQTGGLIASPYLPDAS